ncbi:polymer-forming cytoskeletal protein, partial [Staphylococcus aureus]|nr:polymer-forming cytoskeletal protein [Staphylococcus aureus]
MNSKFELLLDDTVESFGIKLFRIRALISFDNVKAGDVGGYIEKE